MSKKKFKETTVGKILLGAASLVNPTLGGVLEGVLSPADALKEIKNSGISTEDKLKLQTLLIEAQETEEQELTKRHQADAMSDSWMSKNVRPLVLVYCIVLFSIFGVLDSFDNVPFHINDNWIGTFKQVMTSVVAFYFGGRTVEKFKSMK